MAAEKEILTSTKERGEVRPPKPRAYYRLTYFFPTLIGKIYGSYRLDETKKSEKRFLQLKGLSADDLLSSQIEEMIAQEQDPSKKKALEVLRNPEVSALAKFMGQAGPRVCIANGVLYTVHDMPDGSIIIVVRDIDAYYGDDAPYLFAINPLDLSIPANRVICENSW